MRVVLRRRNGVYDQVSRATLFSCQYPCGAGEVCTLALKEVTLLCRGGLYISSEGGDVAVQGRSVH